MENENYLTQIPAQFGESASVKRIFGEPIKVGEKVIIPVAQIAFGFGGGFGKGQKGDKAIGKDEDGQNSTGEGGGGGGGMYARAKGVFVVSPDSTKFVASSNMRSVFAGIAIGFILRGLLKSRRKK